MDENFKAENVETTYSINKCMMKKSFIGTNLAYLLNIQFMHTLHSTITMIGLCLEPWQMR